MTRRLPQREPATGLPERVTIYEVGPRDGLQNEKTVVPVEVKAKVVRLAPSTYGTSRVGVTIVESKDNWLRLFVAWIADDNVVEGMDE